MGLFRRKKFPDRVKGRAVSSCDVLRVTIPMIALASPKRFDDVIRQFSFPPPTKPDDETPESAFAPTAVTLVTGNTRF